MSPFPPPPAVPASEKTLWRGRLEHISVSPRTGGPMRVLASVAISDEHLYWVMHGRTDLTLSMKFDDVVFVELEDGGSVINIVTQPMDYPEGLLIHNPEGVIDNRFGLSNCESIEEFQAALDAGLDRSRMWLAKSKSPELLREWDGTPVVEWPYCPSCGGRLMSKTSNVVACSLQWHLYSDPHFEPVVSMAEADFGSLVGQRSWMALFEFQLPFEDKSLAWIVVPSGHREVPPGLLMNGPAMEAAWGSDTSTNVDGEDPSDLSARLDDQSQHESVFDLEEVPRRSSASTFTPPHKSGMTSRGVGKVSLGMRDTPPTARRMLNELARWVREDSRWLEERKAFILSSGYVGAKTGFAPAAFLNPSRVVVATLAVVSDWGFVLVDSIQPTVHVAVAWESMLRYDDRLYLDLITKPPSMWYTMGFCFYDSNQPIEARLGDPTRLRAQELSGGFFYVEGPNRVSHARQEYGDRFVPGTCHEVPRLLKTKRPIPDRPRG